MSKIQIVNSTAVPLPIENIDTDQIIPARFLKATSKLNFGENLFRDWRFSSNGKKNKDFVLNNNTFSGNILIVGSNFGCGSSREHAAWAIKDYGFDVVISSFFADIFKNNCLNIGVLPVQVSESFLNEIFNTTKSDPESNFEINLINQTVSIIGTNYVESFIINPYKKQNLLNGYDDIDYLINLKNQISDFAKKTPF